MSDNCWGCGVHAGPTDDVRKMAFIERPTKERFSLCAKCRRKESFSDGALTELREG